MIDPKAPEEFIKGESGLFLPKDLAFQTANRTLDTNSEGNIQGAPISPNRAMRRDMMKQAKKHMRKLKRK